MIWIERSKIVLGVFPVLEIVAPELEAYFTSRIGGTSHVPYDSLNLGKGLGDVESRVNKNRKILTEALRLPAGNLAYAEQVHGGGIAIADRGGRYKAVDGLMTSMKNLSLIISTADCYPVVLFAPSEKALAALHVGLGGASSGIIGNAIDMLAEHYRIDIGNTIALIGPGICKRCYTVGEDKASLFSDEVTSLKRGKWHLDLLSLCRIELERYGVRSRNIYSSNQCTSCNPHLFFSHRRERGGTGRHWAIATMKPSP